MTGLEAYDALKAATANLTCGSEFVVQTSDALDLEKLSVSDLESRDYDHSVAERVSADLFAQSLDELGKSMGLRLEKDPNAQRLLP
jgi:hypothetical protein